jgi:excinuclease ABC subunit C
VARIRRATPEQVAEVPGIGPALAERVLAALSSPAAPAVNLTTGEIMGDDGAVAQSGGNA